MRTTSAASGWRGALRSPRLPLALVSGASLACGAVMLAAALARYHAGHAFVLDFGFFRNAIALIAAGHLWARSGIVGFPSLADHLSYVLYPLAILYRLVPQAATLFAVQAFALSLAAIPLYALARRWGGSPVPAAALALAYLIAPWVWSTDLFDWHPEALFPLALFCALWLADRHRFAAATAMIVLALALKEILALCVLGVGVWWLIIHRREREQVRWALLAAALAASVAILDRYLQARWAPGHAAFLSGYFGPLLGGHARLVPGLFYAIGHPGASITQLTVAEKWRTVGRMLMATGFVCLAEPAGIVAMLPGLAITLAASRWPVASGIYAEALPLGATAFVAALGGVRGWPALSRPARAFVLGLTLAAVAVCAVVWTLPYLGDLSLAASPATRAGMALLRSVPAGASIGVSNDGIGALASGRTEVSLIDGTMNAGPSGFYPVARRVDYLLYPQATNVPTAVTVDPALTAANLRAMGYALAADRGGWMLWRRARRPAAPAPRLCRAVGPALALRADTWSLGRAAAIQSQTITLKRPTAVRVAVTGQGWIVIAAQRFGAGPHPTTFASEAFWLSARSAVRTVELGPGEWQWIWVDPSVATPTRLYAVLTGRALACP